MSEIKATVTSQVSKGNTAIRVGVGCEFGKHRSVAMVERLQQPLQAALKAAEGDSWTLGTLTALHRDVDKKRKS